MARHAYFICYRRDDSADVAGRIFDALARKFGAGRIFKDVDVIRPGADFSADIAAALPQCRAFVALIGPRWLSANSKDGGRRLDDPEDLVRREIESALAEGLTVIPVLVNGASLPDESELPDSLRPLVRFHAATIRRDPDFHSDVAKLAHVLARTKPRRPQRQRRWPTLIAATTVFAVLASLAFLIPSMLSADRAEQESTERVSTDFIDRNGIVLATDASGFALLAHPNEVTRPEDAAVAISALFPDMNQETLLRRLTDSNRQTVYLRLGLSSEMRGRVQALGLAGIGFERRTRRYYPRDSLAAHLLGFTDLDLTPLSGVERGLSADLEAAALQNRAVRLSIDAELQEAVEAVLDQDARAANARWASVLLLDGRSGEILAIASWPTFNPNSRETASEENLRDRVVQDLHEPGVAMLPLTVGMALDRGAARPGQSISTADLTFGSHVIPGQTAGRASVDVADIVPGRASTAAARLALLVGRDEQARFFELLGFSDRVLTELNARLPLQAPEQTDIATASRALGYGIAVSNVALAGAYTVFVNDGSRVTPTLLAAEFGADRESVRVFSSNSTRQVLASMGRQSFPEQPNETRLAGVAHMDLIAHNQTFVGVFPAQAPRYVLVVSVNRQESSTGAPSDATELAQAVISAARTRIQIDTGQ